jgi:hypothetical protein
LVRLRGREVVVNDGADGFRVNPAAVDNLASRFDDQSPVFGAVGTPTVEASGRANTGDAGLDAEVGALAGKLEGLFGRAGQGLTQLAGALRDVLDNYETGDAQVAASYQELTPADSAVPEVAATNPSTLTGGSVLARLGGGPDQGVAQ